MVQISENAGTLLSLKFLGEGAWFNPETGSIELTANPEGINIEAVVTIPATADKPAYALHVAVTEVPIVETPVDETVVVVFDTPEKLGQLTFLSSIAPGWTHHPDGFGRLVATGSSRAHGDWSVAQGDGVHRCLLRWSGDELTYSLDRRLSFGARITKTNSDWGGIRVDVYETAAGVRRLHIREYTGSQALITALATVDAPWEYNTWNWLEVSVMGTEIKARIYAENAAVPDWQITATTSKTLPGAFGPGSFPAQGQSQVVDIRRLEFVPPPA